MRTIWLFLGAISISACASNPPPSPESQPSTATTVDDLAGPALHSCAGERCFNRRAAAEALGRAANDSVSCLTSNEKGGDGHVKVTFAPDGHVLEAVVDRPPFDTAPSRSCIESVFARITVPPFDGAPAPVGKSFRLLWQE